MVHSSWFLACRWSFVIEKGYGPLTMGYGLSAMDYQL